MQGIRSGKACGSMKRMNTTEVEVEKEVQALVVVKPDQSNKIPILLSLGIYTYTQESVRKLKN